MEMLLVVYVRAYSWTCRRMTTNYRKGRDKEYRIKKLYEQMGYIVLRTAGSHGFADLVAVREFPKEIIFIQVKPDKYLKEKLIRQWYWLNADFPCSFIVE